MLICSQRCEPGVVAGCSSACLEGTDSWDPEEAHLYSCEWHLCHWLKHF